jgi:large subunit ribosomal protein L15
MPLYRRLAQRGFSNYPFRREWQIVNLAEIEKRYGDGETVDESSLCAKGLIKGGKKSSIPVKILGNGDFTRKLSFKAAAVSAQAKEKIEKAGGSIVLNAPEPERKKSGKKSGKAVNTKQEKIDG